MYHEPTLHIIPCCVDRMMRLDNTALCLSLAGSNPHQRYDHGFFVLHVTAYPSLAEWYNFTTYPCASPWQELTLTSSMTTVPLSYMSLHTPHWQLLNFPFQNIFMNIFFLIHSWYLCSRNAVVKNFAMRGYNPACIWHWNKDDLIGIPTNLMTVYKTLWLVDNSYLYPIRVKAEKSHWPLSRIWSIESRLRK